MNKRKKYTSQQKAQIIMQAIKGRPIADICTEYQISNSMFYKWKEQFLNNMHLAYEVHNNNKQIQQINNQNKKLKNLVAELTLELKKTDW